MSGCVIVNHQQAAAGQVLDHFHVTGETVSSHDPPGCLRSPFTATDQGKHHPPDPVPQPAFLQLSKDTVGVPIEGSLDTTEGMVVGESQPPPALAGPQLSQRELHQRQPTAASRGIDRDLSGQPVVILHTAHPRRFAHRALQRRHTHRRQRQQSILQSGSDIDVVQQRPKEIGPQRTHQPVGHVINVRGGQHPVPGTQLFPRPDRW